MLHFKNAHIEGAGDPSTWIAPLDRFTKILFSLSGKIKLTDIEFVASEEDEAACERLVYQKYLEQGLIDENPLERHSNDYASLDSSTTFLCRRGGRVKGTVTVVKDGEAGIPLEKLYPEEMRSIRRSHRKLAEISMLAIDDAASKGSSIRATFGNYQVLFSLFLAIFVHAREEGIDDLVVVCHPRHGMMYKGLGFTPFGEVKSYEAVSGNPALPLHVSLEQVEAFLTRNGITHLAEVEKRNYV